MSGLPDQDLLGEVDPDEKRYSKNDLQHIIARDQAARDLVRVDNEVIDLRRKMLESSTSFTVELKAMRELLVTLPLTLAAQMTKLREDIKTEIKELHPTRLENQVMKTEIENKIEETDRTLGRQIAALDLKQTQGMTDLKTKLTEEINLVKTDLDKQWLKIVGPITGVIGLAMVITWLLMVYTRLGT